MEQNCATLAEVKWHRQGGTLINFYCPHRERRRLQPTKRTLTTTSCWSLQSIRSLLGSNITEEDIRTADDNLRQFKVSTVRSAKVDDAEAITFDRTKKMGSSEYKMAKKNTESLLKLNGLATKDTHYCESYNNAVLVYVDKRACYQHDSYDEDEPRNTGLEEERSSQKHELVGTGRLYRHFDGLGVQIVDHAHDRSAMVNKLIRERPQDSCPSQHVPRVQRRAERDCEMYKNTEIVS
ncbi:hypothetical protein Bbelb_186710 [Branchiostoma belcheri]|nr:hypothetical protein Bbelb_186710 [Branchiostoma belcheri]